MGSRHLAQDRYRVPLSSLWPMPPKRAWEEPLREWEIPPPAARSDVDDDDSDRDSFFSADSDVGEEEEVNIYLEGEAAGDAFVDFCLEQLYTGRISAKTLSILCWWADRAGAVGAVKKFAYPPNTRATGHFSRHVDKVSGFEAQADGDFYKVEVPIYAKFDAARSKLQLPMILPHEALAADMEENSHVLDQLETAMADTEWADVYRSHPVVTSATRTVLPCSLYLDGVAVTNRDGVLGIWCYAMISEKRHLITVLRKSSLCKCGCRGQCTLHPVFKTIQWSLAALASGKFPTHDPDGRVFSGWRHDVGGDDLGVTGAILHVKGDWMEFSSSLGLPNWATKIAPCPFCDVHKPGLYVLSPFNALSSPWSAVDYLVYEKACSDCEKIVTIGRADYLDILALLHYDRSKKGSRGRALLGDFPPLGLLKGDKLSPYGALNDVADFDQAFDDPLTLSITVCFWRPSLETRARWRNPIFNIAIGVTTDSLAIDTLHCLYLGIAKNFCMCVMWHLIVCNVFHIDARSDLVSMGVIQLRNALWDWYKEEHQRNPDMHLHQLEDLTEKMMGKISKPKIKDKSC